MATNKENINLFIGTYTNLTCKSKGIYNYVFNQETGDFKLKGTTDFLINPSFLAFNSNTETLYCVNENGKTSHVSSIRLNSESEKLRILNQMDSFGEDPCHLICDDTNLIVGNYTEGSISIYKLEEDGSIGALAQTIKHEGRGTHEIRQEKAHVHQVNFSPDKEYVLVNDLGLDKLFVYKYDESSENEVLTLFSSVDFPEAAGPRHLCFGKHGRKVFVARELDGFVSVYTYDDGYLKFIFEISLLPNHVEDNFRVAHIDISDDGKYLYVTNRDGETNNITVFRVLSDKLEIIQQIKTSGENPRNFTITPNGKYLLIANQDTDSIAIFSVDIETGMLTDTNKKIDICAPVFVDFF